MTNKGYSRRDFLKSAGKAACQRADHIGTLVSRYRGAIPSWDAVNRLRDTTP
jgi:GH35 family endo-1,4-beta-xylanase